LQSGELSDTGFSSVHGPSLLAVFLLALAVRFLFLALAGPHTGGDSPEYVTLAHNMAVHKGYTLSSSTPYIPMVRRAPAYPAFIALFTGRGPFHPYRIAAVQILLDSAVAAAIFLLTPAVPMKGVRIAAAVMYAIHPAAVVASSTLLSEALFTFLVACSALLVIAARRADRPALASMAGVVMGLSVLCRPMAMVYAACAAIVLLAWRSRPRAIAHAAAFLAGCALTILPWTIRCTAVTGRLVIVQAAGITNWYLPTRWDWNQNDQETLWPEFAKDPYGRRLNAARTPAEIVAASGLGAELAIRNVKANPRAYLISRIRTYPHLFISTFSGTLGVEQTLGTVLAERRFGTAALMGGFLVVFSLLPIAAAAVGLPRALHDPSGALCGALVISTLLVHLPMWIEYRYWLPVLPYELALGATGACVLAGLLERRGAKLILEGS
jgi:4-amino-4-deoxy-L-arabinose transferase-like glycosyltransferase